MTQKGNELHDDAVGGDASVETDNGTSLRDSINPADSLASVEVGTTDNPSSPDECTKDDDNVPQEDPDNAEQLESLMSNLTVDGDASALNVPQEGEPCVDAAGGFAFTRITDEPAFNALENDEETQANLVSKLSLTVN